MKDMRIVKILILALMIPLNLLGQSDEMRDIFVEAESHYLFGEYELANPLYLIINEYVPGNSNIMYKIGNCYLNISGEKTKAIPFLEEAVKNASYDAKEDSYKETRAPLDAFFSLATAYRINNEFDKALNTYSRLNNLMSEKEELVNADFIDQQINACRTALKLIETPITFSAVDLGPGINLGSINSHPVISGNGNIIVYTEERGLENTIYSVRKELGQWGEPIDITAQLGDAKDCASTSLNFDGTELFLYKNDEYDGNIYVSTFANGSWSKIRKLNKNINTKYYESHASISADGTKLYFTSNREGGEGALDIYVSERDESGEWGPAKNLGSAINTPFNEDTPFISGNDSILFFSSEGHANMGGYDLFQSRMQGGSWKTPSNFGYQLSTSDDDLFFQPFNNGANGYYSMFTGYKEKHIHYITMGESGTKTRMFEIKGIVTLSDTVIEFSDDFRVLLIGKNSNDTIDVSFPNRSTGFYHLMAKADEYILTWEGKGYISYTQELSIYEDHPTTEEVINVTLEPDESWEPEVLDKLDFSQVQVIDAIDSSILRTDLILRDVSDSDSTNIDVLYYTVQLMALHNPVDVSFFRNTDVTVLYNAEDLFYRYTTGRFTSKEEAYAKRTELIRIGYPDEIFVKTVFSGSR